MFTGIIEALGTVQDIQERGSNLDITINSPIASELSIDQSVAHNGVCLTVTDCDQSIYKVSAIHETLEKSNLKEWVKGTKVNLERSMPANGRFDGHIVQGHVDTIAICKNIEDRDGSWAFTFELGNATNLMVEKGSICINGISLTLAQVQPGSFTVEIIPYTYEHTNLKDLQPGGTVNIEFDILGKYVQKMMAT